MNETFETQSQGSSAVPETPKYKKPRVRAYGHLTGPFPGCDQLGRHVRYSWRHSLFFMFFCCFVSVTFSHAQTTSGAQTTDKSMTGSWGALRTIRDNTNTWLEGKPEGGWWVSLVHATLLPNGDIIATGMSRRAERDCFFGGFFEARGGFVGSTADLIEDQYGKNPHSAAQNGISYVLSPSEIQNNPKINPSEIQKGSLDLLVTPVTENGKNPSGGPPGQNTRDVLFCAGHSPIGNGQVLFTGEDAL